MTAENTLHLKENIDENYKNLSKNFNDDHEEIKAKIFGLTK